MTQATATVEIGAARRCSLCRGVLPAQRPENQPEPNLEDPGPLCLDCAWGQTFLWDCFGGPSARESLPATISRQIGRA